MKWFHFTNKVERFVANDDYDHGKGCFGAGVYPEKHTGWWQAMMITPNGDQLVYEELFAPENTDGAKQECQLFINHWKMKGCAPQGWVAA